MRLMLDRLPPTLLGEREALRMCLEAFEQAMPIQAVSLFGSHARGEGRPDSDVDLCIVSEFAVDQLAAAARLRRATRDIRPKPSFTLIPITPDRLKEKQEAGDHFFRTVLEEGIRLAA